MGGAEDHYTQIGDYKGGVRGDASDDLRMLNLSGGLGSGGIVDIWDTAAPAYGKNGVWHPSSIISIYFACMP
jgi:hypothetical protein